MAVHLTSALLLLIVVALTTERCLCAQENGTTALIDEVKRDKEVDDHFKRSAEFGKSLSPAQRERFVKLASDIHTPRGQLSAKLRSLTDELTEEQKKTALELSQRESLERPKLNSSEPLSDEASTAYQRMKEAEEDGSLSQLGLCKRFSEIGAGLSGADKDRLQIPPVDLCEKVLETANQKWASFVLSGGESGAVTASPQELAVEMDFLLRSYQLAKKLTKEQKEEFVKYLVDIDTPSSELKAGLRRFKESLPEEQKQAFADFRHKSARNETHSEQTIPTTAAGQSPSNASSVSEGALAIFNRRQEIENDSSLSQVQSCEQIKLIETGLTPADRIRLHLPGAIKNCRAELTTFWKLWKEVVMGATGAPWETDPVARLMQAAELAKSLTKEQRERFIRLFVDVDKPSKQIVAELKEFAESLKTNAEKQKDAVLALAQAMEEYTGPPLKNGTHPISQEGLDIYGKIQKIQGNLELSQVQACEQSLAFIAKMSEEDRVELKLPAATSNCRASLDAMWVRWEKLLMAVV